MIPISVKNECRRAAGTTGKTGTSDSPGYLNSIVFNYFYHDDVITDILTFKVTECFLHFSLELKNYFMTFSDLLIKHT